MEQEVKNITLQIHIEFTQISQKITSIQEMYIMLKSVSQLERPCVSFPFKNLNHDFQISKLSVETDLENELMVAKGKDS